ncbi:helix-turn-helix transcriptional regulator [Nocardia sp. NPDC050710]|uniref:helix-turn-helix domain-containing protein n=1 Tax=Nocardia sp. NPDC050710 TaxID=3157220 RepID=UPI0033C5A2E0
MAPSRPLAVSDAQLDAAQNLQELGVLLKQAMEHSGVTVRAVETLAAEAEKDRARKIQLTKGKIEEMRRGRNISDDRLRLALMVCNVPDAQIARWLGVFYRSNLGRTSSAVEERSASGGTRESSFSAGVKPRNVSTRLRLAIGSLVGVGVLIIGLFIFVDKDSPATDTSAAPPFTWESVLSEKIGGFMFQQDVTALGPPPPSRSVPQFQKWAADRQGIAAHVMGNDQGTVTAVNAILLNLTASTPGQAVTLRGMEIEVLERQPAMSGTHAAMEGIGGRAWGRYADFDLDSDPPKMVESSSGAMSPDGSFSIEPIQFPYVISGTDTELFYIWVRTLQHVKWRIKVRWISGAHSGEAMIDDHGKPFEVAMPGPNATRCLSDASSPSAWLADSGSRC